MQHYGLKEPSSHSYSAGICGQDQISQRITTPLKTVRFFSEAHLPRESVCNSSDTRHMAMKLFTLYGASGKTLMTEMAIPMAAARKSVARTSDVTASPWSWMSHLGKAGKRAREGTG